LAVARLDALARATGITKQNLMSLVDRYSGARGNKRARSMIDLMDRPGWHVVKVIKEDRPHDIISRVWNALARRGYAVSPPDRSLGYGAA